MSSFEVVDAAGIELGEHPVWDPEIGRAGWVDVFAGELRWLDDDGVERWRFPAPLGAVALRKSGGVVAAAGDGIHFRDAAGQTDREPITGFLPEGVRFNDAACDPDGNFVFGTTSLRGEPDRGSLYRVGADGDVETLASGVTESNGLAWSRDGATLYYVDSGEPVVRRYAYDPQLPPERGADLFTVPDGEGVPDGICIDVDGAVWVGIWEGGAVWRVSPQGEVLEVVETPVSRPTCPAFGGPGLVRLFVATAWEGMDESERGAEPWAGNLLAYEPAVPGAPAPAFAG
jgi:sugar lactone lactonase YvrE